MRPKVVVDTNVYISAILWGGKPEKIREFARKRVIDLFISEAILTEIASILRIKFDWESWQVSQVIDNLRSFSTLLTPKVALQVIKEHDSDNRILECAVEGKVHYIISGDKHHLQPLGDYQGIKVLSPGEFLEHFYKEHAQDSDS